MITVDEVESEVIVGIEGTSTSKEEEAPEVLRERLRGVVRELVREEVERYLRTVTRG